ncbi:hypothetical protein ARMSODRAFT_1022213 [Armillaria solidipes]|uniref:Uncharacterized protein n=1 Tax=Armillaria solidipes TaxID=1076256 RepID=A0A2H3B952_9AGAR|nr:hypothetical protein ARMSODRAFT_1022213 [Armillaria solidipes]
MAWFFGLSWIEYLIFVVNGVIYMLRPVEGGTLDVRIACLASSATSPILDGEMDLSLTRFIIYDDTQAFRLCKQTEEDLSMPRSQIWNPSELQIR